MLKLISCEFQKLKRKKFIQLTIGAAVLFPIPITILMARDSQTFDQLFRACVMFGEFLFLPCVLGVIAAMLFLMERDNDTLKNLLAIPVSRTKIVFAKICVLLGLSILYSVAGLGASLIGGIIVGHVGDILFRFGISICLGLFVLVATLPVIMVILIGNKSYIFSIILSFAYAVISFAVTMMFGSNPEAVNTVASILPIPLIMKWYLGTMPVEAALSYILPYTVSLPYISGIMILYGSVFSILSVSFYKRSTTM
ncbi:MAG: ABC transporter permease [Eubacteriales bacterium]|nr:ABC transporter permease [Eubacteriales bacterium]